MRTLLSLDEDTYCCQEQADFREISNVEMRERRDLSMYCEQCLSNVSFGCRVKTPIHK